MDVPNPTSVSPITRGEMRSCCATATDPRTSASPPDVRTIKPAIRIRTSVINDLRHGGATTALCFLTDENTFGKRAVYMSLFVFAGCFGASCAFKMST